MSAASRSIPATLAKAAWWGAAVAGLAYGCYFFLGFTLDDPFISFRYAENLVRGHGLVFNVGERVEGYSNLLWVLVMAALIRIHPVFSSANPEGLILAAKLLGALLAFACVPYLLRLSRLLADENEPDGNGWLHFVPILILGSSVCFPLWAVSGLETPLFAFLLLLAADLYLRGIRGARRSLWAAAFLLWAVGLTRPEGFFIATAFALHLGLWGRHAGGRRLRLGWLGLLALGVAAMTLFRVLYYGSWLPNTYFAKIDPPTGWGLEAGASQAIEGVAHTLGIPALLVTVLAGKRLWTQSMFLVALVIFFGLGFIVLSRGDWMPGYRFLVPYLPWLGLLFAASLRVLVRPAQGSEARRRGMRRSATTIVLAGLVLAAALFVIRQRINDFRREQPFWPLHKGGTLIQAVYVETGLWIREHIAPTALLAVAEAGTIPFLVPNRVLDLLALNDAFLARSRDNFSPDYVFSRAPEYILLAGVTRTPRGEVSSYFYGQSLLSDARFQRSYVACLSFGTAPEDFRGGGQNFVLYARRDCDCGTRAAEPEGRGEP